MEKRLLKYVNGFSLKRSFNKHVLASDKEIQEAYTLMQDRGKIPFNRTKVLIVGDHAAGKTSTYRCLQGKIFRPEEPSTIGIETNTVNSKVSNVNSKWRETKITPQDEFESSTAWLAVMHVLKCNNKETYTNCVENEKNKQLGEVLYYFMFCLPILIIFLFVGFTFGFGLVVWLYIASLMTFCDTHSAYRFGCGFSLALVLIDNAVSTNQSNIEIQSEIDIWSTCSFIITLTIYGLISIIVGMLMGMGGRTGMCFSLCFMIHPQQKLYTFENAVQQFTNLYSNVALKIILFLCSIVTLFVFKKVHQTLLLFKRRRLSTLFLTILLLASVLLLCFGRKFIVALSTSAYIIFIVVFIMSGVLSGRIFVAYGYNIFPNYIFKKSVGFIVGISLAYLCKWEFPDYNSRKLNLKVKSITFWFNLMLYFAPVAGFILYELFAFMKVKYTKSIPILHVRKSLQATVRKEHYLDVRFSLWDFAGQEMYYNTHHLFMSNQGVYLIMFNAAEITSHSGRLIKRLQFWLQSIAMHADCNNAVALLVGTRRDSVVDKGLLSLFDNKVKKHLYRRFCKLLAFHPSGRLCFFLENNLKFDNEYNNLREVIHIEVQQLEFFQEMQSVKYILFKETLNKFCRENCIITNIETITNELNVMQKISPKNKKAKTISINDVRDSLKLFNKSGDVIYNDRDEWLCNYVVCNPQALIDILKILINVPDPSRRNRRVADLWQILEDEGRVDSRLIEHICRVQGIWRLYPCVIRFLVATYLLFPLYVTNEIDQIGSFCLPCKLPKINDLSRIWCTNATLHDDYLFDFGEMLQEFIFLRLLAKCCAVFTWDVIYYNAARFRVTFGNSECIFLISTKSLSGTFEKNFIQLEVQNEESEFINIPKKILNFIKDIISVHFNIRCYNQFLWGVKCKKCSSLDGTIYLVNCISDGKDMFELESYTPDQFHSVSLKRKVKLLCNRPTS